MTNRNRITFHRNGQVSAGDLIVGSVMPPDPSGPPHVRVMVWKFTSWDGRCIQMHRRQDLRPVIDTAWSRKMLAME